MHDERVWIEESHKSSSDVTVWTQRGNGVHWGIDLYEGSLVDLRDAIDHYINNQHRWSPSD